MTDAAFLDYNIADWGVDNLVLPLALDTPNEEYYSVPPVPTVSNCEVLTGGTGGTPVHSTTIGHLFRIRGWMAELST